MPQPLSDADLDACRAALRGGSRSFFAASLVMPPFYARRAAALYAFCRAADDLIDEGGEGAQGVARLRARLDAIYAGRPGPHAADRAFATVVREIGLPRAAPDALIEGFAWDAQGRRYETLDDLLAYAARVAGCVGAMMAVAMERRDAGVLARAADLGCAMQLTNIARDVGEDARAGRLYLPLAWMREAGLDPDAFLAAPRFSPALGGVVARLLTEADRLYARADCGVARLPWSCRPAIGVARKLYAAIGAEIARADFDSVSRRAVAPLGRKVAAALAPLSPAGGVAAPPLAATRFLVEATSVPSLAADAGRAWWDLYGRTIGVLGIFERLARSEREAAAMRRPIRTI